MGPQVRRRHLPEPHHRRWLWIIGAVAASICVIAVAVALALPRADPTPAEATPSGVASSSAIDTGTVEVPNLVGASLKEARTLAQAATLAFRVSNSASETAASRVDSQTPSAGILVPAGSELLVSLAAAPATATVSAKPRGKQQWVVVLDAGHQARTDMVLEPIGPGSAQKKERSSGGATGVLTQIPEHEITLQLATNLKQRLEAAGIQVVMTRTTNDVSISNIERATLANKAKAALFVRIHADGSADPAMSGVSTLYPTDSGWTKTISPASLRAARLVQRDVLRATGAADRGVVPRGDLAGFNFAKVPSLLIETGYLTNAIEDRLLASPGYQDKIAEGLKLGILEYLKGQ